MLICPLCTFANSDSNNFCQNCGTSLTHKICPQCGAEVVLNAQYCNKCAAECGQIWYALITQTADELISATVKTEKLPQNSENLADVGDSRPFLKFAVDSYLDFPQRYRILESLPTPEVILAHAALTVRVLDCQPYQLSPIGAMFEHHTKMVISTIPNLAKAYLELQVEMHPAIPKIHDAWQQDNLQIILVEDRSNLPMLLDFWQQNTIDLSVISRWLDQMAQLWELLEKVDCCQSLLELSNLRLDHHQTLVLQRLYPDHGQLLTTQNLVQLWQTLLKQSQGTTPFNPLWESKKIQMLADIESGHIQTLTQMRTICSDISLSPLSEMDKEMEAVLEVSSGENPDSSLTVLQLGNETENTILSDQITNIPLSPQLITCQLITWEYAAYTDTGRQRDHNEDYFAIVDKVHKQKLPEGAILTKTGLYILCDGMGGHAGGEVASKLAVNTIRKYFQETWTSAELPNQESIKEAVYLANQAIYDLNQQQARSGMGRMGTTLVMLLLQDHQAAIAHVGDSRLYCLTHREGLVQLTIDHEVGQREISRGVDPTIAYGRADAYQLTQALGPRDQNYLHPDISFFDIHEDMLLLLVSDGLSDNECLETHWQTHLQPLLSYDSDLEMGIQDLIELGNEYNGHDNITAILVRVKVCPS